MRHLPDWSSGSQTDACHQLQQQPSSLAAQVLFDDVSHVAAANLLGAVGHDVPGPVPSVQHMRHRRL